MRIFIYHEMRQKGGLERPIGFTDRFDVVSALSSSFTITTYHMGVKFGSCWRFPAGLMHLLPGFMSIITALIDNCTIKYP
jgi:hypothetical protein